MGRDAHADSLLTVPSNQLQKAMPSICVMEACSTCRREDSVDRKQQRFRYFRRARLSDQRRYPRILCRYRQVSRLVSGATTKEAVIQQERQAGAQAACAQEAVSIMRRISVGEEPSLGDSRTTSSRSTPYQLRLVGSQSPATFRHSTDAATSRAKEALPSGGSWRNASAQRTRPGAKVE